MNGVSQKVREVVGDLESNPTGVLSDLKTSRWRFEVGPPTDRRELGWYYVDRTNGRVYENKTGIYEDTGYTLAGGGGGGITGGLNLGEGVPVFSGEDPSGSILEFKTIISDRTGGDPQFEKNIIIRGDTEEINLTIQRSVDQVDNTLLSNIPLFKDVTFDLNNVGTLNMKVISSSDEPDGSEFTKIDIQDTGDLIDFKPYKCVNQIVNADGGTGGLVTPNISSGDGTNRQTVPIKNIRAGSGIAIVEGVNDITLSANITASSSYYYQYQVNSNFYSIGIAWQNIPPFTVNVENTSDWLGVENVGGESVIQYLGDNDIVYRLSYDIQGVAKADVGSRHEFNFRIGTGAGGSGPPVPVSGCTFPVPANVAGAGNDLVYNSVGASFLFKPVQNELYTLQAKCTATSQKDIKPEEIKLSITRA